MLATISSILVAGALAADTSAATPSLKEQNEARAEQGLLPRKPPPKKARAGVGQPDALLQEADPERFPSAPATPSAPGVQEAAAPREAPPAAVAAQPPAATPAASSAPAAPTPALAAEAAPPPPAVVPAQAPSAPPPAAVAASAAPTPPPAPSAAAPAPAPGPGVVASAGAPPPVVATRAPPAPAPRHPARWRERVVDEQGWIVERLRDQDGRVLREKLAGHVVQLAVVSAWRTQDGSIVQVVADDVGSIEVRRDPRGRFLSAVPIAAAHP
jgi:hypothetical protein